MKQVTFGYGILCDPLENQANQQGFTLGEKYDRFEIMRYSINQLRMNFLLTDSEKKKLIQKLHKRVIETLQPLEEQEEKNFKLVNYALDDFIVFAATEKTVTDKCNILMFLRNWKAEDCSCWEDEE